MSWCCAQENQEVEVYPINSAPRSDAPELSTVAPKEMVRVFGLSNTWYVKQDAKPCISFPCCKCSETATFKVGSSLDGTANMFTGVETSSPCINLFCCHNASSTTQVLYGNSAEVAEQNQVLLIERFLRLPAMPLKCCCLQYTTVTDVQNQKLLGSTRENFWLCVPTYTIYGPEGEEVMDVHQRACCCSCAVDCCAKDSSCCGLRVPFQLYYPGTDQSVGTINKMWRNFCSEFVHDDDVFRFTGPEVQVVRDTGAFQLGDIDKKIAARGEMLVRDLKSAVGITDKQYRYDLSRLPPRSWEQSSQLLAASLLLNEIHFE